MSQPTSIDQLAGLVSVFIQQQQSINNSVQQQLTSQQESMDRLIALLQANTQAGNSRNQPAVQPSPRGSIMSQLIQPTIPPLNIPNSQITTEVQQRIPFHRIVEGYVQANLPQLYQQYASRPDYDPIWWSWSLEEAAPKYTQGMNNNTLTRRRVLFNDVLYSQIPPGSIARYRKNYPERFRAIDDVNYNPTAIQNMVMASNGVIPVQQTTRQMTQQQLRKNLKAEGLRYVKQDPVARYMAKSLTVGELRNLEPNIGTELPGIESLSERVFFNGILTETEYVVNLSYFTYGDTIDLRNLTIPMFVELIKRVLINRTSQDIGSNTVLPPYYSVFLWYTRPEILLFDPVEQAMQRIPPSQRRIKIFSGTVFNSMVTNFIIEPNLEAELLQLTGSDVEELAEHMLDITRFFIQKIDLTRNGGSAILLRQSMSRPTNSKDHQVHILPWAKIWDYHSTQNGCFMKILNEVLKRDKRAQYKSYRQLWSAVSPDTYNQELTFEQISDIAQQLGYKLYVYNVDGQIIHGLHPTEPSESANRAGLPQLHLLFFEGHYMLIREIYSSADNVARPELIKEDLKKAKDFNLVPVYYDLETVYVEEAGAESNLRPYSISWLIETKQAPSEVVSYDISTSEILERTTIESNGPVCKVKLSDFPTTDLFEHLMTDLRNHGPGNKFVLIAYNGSGFDHVFLFSYLVRNGYRVKTAPKSTGKIRHMKFWISYGQEGFSVLEVWDPYLFVMRSLDQAASDFGIPIKKLPFDHEVIQNAYLTGRLSDFLTRNRQLVEEYNCRDVQVLRMFTNKLVQTLSKLTGFSIKVILSCQTLPGLCFKFWRKLLCDTAVKNSMPQLASVPCPKTEFPKAAKDVKTDKKIRSATIGGRVEGTPGVYNGDFRMVDVVSLYPTVMAMFNYPFGEEIIVKDGNQALQYYAQNYLGLYYINYDQSSLVTEHTILPQRILSGLDPTSPTGKGKLSWTKGSGTGWVPLITIQLLMQYGAKVSLIPDEDGESAIVWDKNSPMFKQYVDTLSKIKQEQDMFKAKGDSRYNNSLREMVKLMLNSLSGKVIQRNFDNASVFVQSEKEFTDAMNQLGSENWVGRDVTVSPVTTSSAFIEYKIIDPYKRPMPSQLGIFIYAYARAYMFVNVFSKAHVYYSDTDSAVILFSDYNKLPTELLPIQYVNMPGSATLTETVIREKQFGDLELEEADYELPDGRKFKIKQYTTLVVIASKTYALYYQNQIVKYRLKGVRKSDEFYDPAAVIEGVEGSGWKPIEKYVYDSQTEKYKRTERNVERLFELLAQRFNNPESTVRIRSWQFKKVVREGRIERLAIEKII